MSEKIATGILTVLFMGMLVLAILLGVFSESFWAGALAFISVFSSLISLTLLATDSKSSKGFFFLSILGVLALAGASTLAHLQPYWLIITLWFFSAFPMVFGSDFTFKAGRFQGYLATLLALLAPSLALAFFASFSGIAGFQFFLATMLVWTLLIGALSVLIIALIQAYSSNKGNYFICVFLGLAALSAAAWVSNLRGGWWWALPWMAAAILVGFGAHALPKWKTKTGTLGIIIAVLCGLVAVGFPLLSTGVISPGSIITVNEPGVSVPEPGKTLSALEVASTELAIAQAEATQTYLDEQSAASRSTQQAWITATQAYLQTRMAESTEQSLAKTQTQTTKLTQPTPTPTTVVAVREVKPTQKIPAITAVSSQGPGFLGAVGKFLLATIKSFWGIVYLLIFFGLGQLWIRKWGGWLLLALLLLLVGLAGGRNQASLDLFNQIISSGPATWWQMLMSASDRHFSSIGWGILALGALVPLLELPGIRINRVYSQRSVKAQAAGNQAVLPNKRENLAIWINLIISLAVPIALWVALRRMSMASGTPFPLLLIPDLAVPHWKPVWHIAYFMVGALFLISYNIALRAQSKQRSATPMEKMSLWGSIPIAVIATLLVPCGVLLFLTAQNLSLLLFTPLLNRGLEQAGEIHPAPSGYPIPEPEPEPWQKPQPQPKPEPEPRPKPQPKPDIKPYQEPEDEKPFQGGEETIGGGETISPDQGESSDLAGETLSELSSPIVGGYLKDSAHLCLLDENGHLFWLQGKRIGPSTSLSITSPQHLLASQEGKLVAVSGSGQIQSINAAGEFQVSPMIKLQSGIEECAVNPFGTLLAFVPQDRSSTLHGYFLAASNDQDFIDLGEDYIACLAFSQNGRFIGLGLDNGGLKVIDIATRQVCLDIPDQGYGTLVQLETTQDERWVAMYADGWVACWDMQGVQNGLVELTHYGVNLAIDSARSRILVGDDQGYLWAYPEDLSTQEYGEQVQDGSVNLIFPAPDGSAITISDQNIVRKTNLN